MSEMPPPPPDSSDKMLQDDLAVLKDQPPPVRVTGKGRYGKGYTRNALHAAAAADMHTVAAAALGIEPDWKLRHLLGARATSTDADQRLEAFIQRLWDQRLTSMCTGFAFGRAAHVRLLKIATDAGLDVARIPRPSMLGIYDGGIAAGREFLTQPLKDEGAIPAQIVLGMSTQGIPADADWPPGGFDAAYAADPVKRKFVTDEPPLGVLERASAFTLQGFFQIDSEGAQLCADVEHAIESGYPVPVGVEVDRAFEDYAGGDSELVEAYDPKGALGGHMLCVVGFDRRAGVRRYRVVNSWGAGWGDGGMFWASERWLQSAYDRYAITVTPAA